VPASMKIAVAGATGRVGSRVVELLETSGHDVVPISRSTGVNVVTGEGLAKALVAVECVIDAASGTARGKPGAPQAAREFFTTAARNLHEFGRKAGVQRMVEVSVIGINHFTTGQGAAHCLDTDTEGSTRSMNTSSSTGEPRGPTPTRMRPRPRSRRWPPSSGGPTPTPPPACAKASPTRSPSPTSA
jgi:hypothetical protein